MFGTESHDVAQELRALTTQETVAELDEKRYRSTTRARKDRSPEPPQYNRYSHDIWAYWNRLATA